ncbi:hypothetical protein P9112_010369 [Eukaryota sp. TZLM1-RC]
MSIEPPVKRMHLRSLSDNVRESSLGSSHPIRSSLGQTSFHSTSTPSKPQSAPPRFLDRSINMTCTFHSAVYSPLFKSDTSLQDVRRRILSALSNHLDLMDLIADALKQLRQFLSQSDNELSLPVFYASKTLSRLLSAALHSLKRLPEVQNGDGSGSKCLQGPVGVGKSTFLRAVFCFSCLLFPDYRTVMHDFECDNSSDLATIESLIEMKQADDDIQNNRCKSLPTVLLLDEINAVYDFPNTVKAVAFIKSLLVFAKSAKNFSIITGSTSFLFERVFNAVDSEFRSKGFPSLNHSVFLAEHLMPIRDMNEFKKFCDIAFPNSTIHNYGDAFNATGGVGRYLNHYISNDQRELSVDHLFAALDDPKFEAFCSFFVQLDRHNVPISQIKSLNIRNSDINRFKDKSLILEQDSLYHLLIPKHMEYL